MTNAPEISRNPGIPLDLAWVQSINVNRPAVIRRAATHEKRRSVKKHWQLGWLAKIISLIDLTTLAGDDTPTNVQRLCLKAKNPLREDLAKVSG